MKKWMALLLACLLCLCAVGAMAETVERVELTLGNGRIRLYPNGYAQRSFENFHPHDAATTQYVITGSIKADTMLDIYLVPHGQEQEYATEDVVYNISFYNAALRALDRCTAIRIGNGEKGKANGHTITLNLSNHGNSLVQAHNHPAISSEIDGVTVNIHNHSGGILTLQDRNNQNGAFRDNITLNVAGSNVTDGTNNKTFNNTGARLAKVDRLEPTCEKDGNLEYWTCDKCHMYFLDEKAELITTLDGVRLPAQHALVKVDRAEPTTCTVDGHIEHWKCTGTCGKLFADANGTKELTADNVRLPAQHITQKVEAKTPTTEADGHIEHYLCTRCKALFADEKATTELTADEVILPKLVRTDSLPQTGDSSHLLRWMAVLLGACFGVVAVRSRRRG